MVWRVVLWSRCPFANHFLKFFMDVFVVEAVLPVEVETLTDPNTT
jgi:hypothetical protein